MKFLRSFKRGVSDHTKSGTSVSLYQGVSLGILDISYGKAHNRLSCEHDW